MNENYLSTSEFAKICGVKKHTLFHYDAIGLLKPELVGENGYRYYSASQFYTFDLIAVLKETGMPLREIRDCIEQRNTDRFIELLREKQRELEIVSRKIAGMKRLLKNTIELSETARRAPAEQPGLRELKAEFLVETRIGPDTSERAQVEALCDHFKFCRRRGLEEQEYPLGAIASGEEILGGNYQSMLSFFSKCSRRFTGGRFREKPAGLYAEILHKGSYESMGRSYERLLGFIQKMGYQIAGDFYEYDILSHLATWNPEEYILSIQVRVEKGPKETHAG